MSLPREQAWLLRAALLGGAEGAAAWRRWRASVELAHIDRGSTRLLPLLWHNLLANGIDDPWMARFKGVYRHTWFANQVHVRRVRQVEAALRAAGVECLALKGVALAHADYPNPGLRPMDDLDVLVRSADVAAAVAALREAGWSSPIRRPQRVLEVVHGTEFRAPDGARLDLHGHLFQGSLHGDLDTGRWARAELLDLPDGPLRVLEPTDQLLHVLVHGVESDPPAPRWLADALMVMRRRGSDLDWSRLLADAEAESRALAVAQALRMLCGVFGEDIPALPTAVTEALAARRWTAGQRFEQRIASGPRIFILGYLVQRIVDYRRWRRTGLAGRQSTGFAHYLRLNWDLDGFGQLPGQVVRRGLRAAGADLSALVGRLRPARRPADETSTRP